MKFSANLGFLWTELPLPEAIRAASKAGFDAVECHWPYETPAAEVLQALDECGLRMLGLNTIRGKTGENGLSALPRREADARPAIDQSIAYARDIRASNIHVMAGIAEGPDAHDTFVGNLVYACDAARAFGITILIEPLNTRDAPGYFLTTSRQAEKIIRDVSRPNLKLMFDCYHLEIMEGNVLQRLTALMPVIGHIQIASVPERAEPDTGDIDYGRVFGVLRDLAYILPIGAEYRPRTTTDAGLGWMKSPTFA